MDPSDPFADHPPAGRASQAAHDRLRRKRERLAAQAAAAAGVAGVDADTVGTSYTPPPPGSSQPSALGLHDFGQSSSLQLHLPGPISPIPLRGGTPPTGFALAPPLQPYASASSPLALGHGHGQGHGPGAFQGQSTLDLSRQTSLVPSITPSSKPSTAQDRRRDKEKAGQAIGIEDEIEWGDEEDTLDRVGEVQVPSFPLAGLNLTVQQSRASSSENGSEYPGVAGANTGGRSKKSRWNPHAIREDETGETGFLIVKPDGFSHKSLGIDARWKRDKKKEERKEVMGKLFRLGKKGKEEEGQERKREAWEDEIEGKVPAATRDPAAQFSQPNTSKASLPSSKSGPVRSILRQPGQPSRRLKPSITAPELAQSSQDPVKPSPATQSTELSSAYASGNLVTPPVEHQNFDPEIQSYPLPPARTPSGHTPLSKAAEFRRRQEASQAVYGAGAGTALVAPPVLGEPNMDRRPSNASSIVPSSAGINATQTSLVSATESQLFYMPGSLEVPGSSANAVPTRPNLGRAESSFGTLGAPQMQAIATGSSLALPLLAAEPLSAGMGARNQDSRYPSLFPRTTQGNYQYGSSASPSPVHLGPAFSHTPAYLLPFGFNPNRRPSDSALNQSPTRGDGIGRSNRSVSETSLGRQGHSRSSTATPTGINRSQSKRESATPRAALHLRAFDSPRSDESAHSFASLASATRESLGMLHPYTDPFPRSAISPPAAGLPTSSTTGNLATRRAQAPTSGAGALSKTGSFFSRSTSNLLSRGHKLPPAEICEHFLSNDRYHRDAIFRAANPARESHMETYFPPSNSTSRDILHAILPEAPTTLGRIQTLVKLRTTVQARVHHPDTGNKRTRPSTAMSVMPTLPSPADKAEGGAGSTDMYPAQWKKMVLVLTAFEFDGDAPGSYAPGRDAHARGNTAGPEQTVVHLHLFDADPATSPPKTRRPKTGDAFGIGGGGGGIRGLAGTYQPENERLETDRKALLHDAVVVHGQIMNANRYDVRARVDRGGQWDKDGDEEEEGKVRYDVLWFGWAKEEGWFIQFKDKQDIDQWTEMTRALIRRMGRDQLAIKSFHMTHRIAEAQERRNSAQQLSTRTPAQHISHHLLVGHTIWNPLTNPRDPAPPLSSDSLPATLTASEKRQARWLAYEHPTLKPLRDKDKLETFEYLACGKVGWREWLWPVPPDKQAQAKSRDKRAENRRSRRRKQRARQAVKRKEAIAAGIQVQPRRKPIRTVSKSSVSSGLSSLAANAVRLERQLDPGTVSTPQPTSPPVSFLGPPDSARAVQTRQSWSTLASHAHSDRSSVSAYSAQSGGSDSTIRSGGTFGHSSALSRGPSASTPARHGTRSRPSTANKALPPPPLPPPSAPLPAPPTPVLARPDHSRASSAAASVESSLFDHDRTLDMFPAPPSTWKGETLTPRMYASTPPAFSYHQGTPGPPLSRANAPMGGSASLGPAIRRVPSMSRTTSASSIASRPGQVTAPQGILAGQSTISLASIGSTTSGNSGNGSLTPSASGSSLTGAAARRARLKAAPIDLAGEIKIIDDAKEDERRAIEAARAAAEDPIDEDRPRAIRFA